VLNLGNHSSDRRISPTRDNPSRGGSPRTFGGHGVPLRAHEAGPPLGAHAPAHDDRVAPIRCGTGARIPSSRSGGAGDRRGRGGAGRASAATSGRRRARLSGLAAPARPVPLQHDRIGEQDRIGNEHPAVRPLQRLLVEVDPAHHAREAADGDLVVTGEGPGAPVWRVGDDPDAPWVLATARPGTRISRAAICTPTLRWRPRIACVWNSCAAICSGRRWHRTDSGSWNSGKAAEARAHVVRTLVSQLARLTTAIDELDRAATALLPPSEPGTGPSDADLLQTIPGIGSHTAATLLGELGALTRFTDARPSSPTSASTR
jgi:hypothetical protein